MIWTDQAIVANSIRIVMMIASQVRGVPVHRGAGVIGVPVGHGQQSQHANDGRRGEGDQTGLAGPAHRPEVWREARGIVKLCRVSGDRIESV